MRSLACSGSAVESLRLSGFHPWLVFVHPAGLILRTWRSLLLSEILLSRSLNFEVISYRTHIQREEEQGKNMAISMKAVVVAAAFTSIMRPQCSAGL